MHTEENTMKKIKNIFNETAYHYVSESGLNTYLIHRPGFKQSSAVYGTPFGALNLSQTINGETQVEHKSGLAHFLEHKLFEDDAVDVLSLFAQIGASGNAFTSYDQTMYYFNHNGPIAEPLKLLINFVSQFDISTVSVEKEKGIIVEEIKMYEQMPDMNLLMETYRNVFHNYPFIYDIAGTEESVNATTLEDLEEAYRLNYADHRMVLVIVSGESLEDIKDIVDEACKDHSKEDLNVQDVYPEEPTVVKHAHREIKGDITTPKMSYAFKFKYGQGNRLRDEFLLKIILEMNFSELNPEYQTLLDSGIFTNAFGFDVDLRDDLGVIYFFNESNEFEKFIVAIDTMMAQLNLDELLFTQLKKRYYGEMIFSLSNISRIGISFARAHFDGINYYDYLEMVNELTYEDLDSVRSYFSDVSKTSLLMTPF